MNYFLENFPDYDVDENGSVTCLSTNTIVNQEKSNEYRLVYLRDKDNNVKIIGVHVAVAMKYLDYFEGCNVHHKNMNKSDNNVNNLEVMDLHEHLRMHSYTHLSNQWVKGNIPWNKGKKMSKEFRAKCKASAIKRAAREREKSISRAKQTECKGIYNSKSIMCLNNNQVYPSIVQAANCLGLIDSSIVNVLKGRQKHTHGYTFKYT